MGTLVKEFHFQVDSEGWSPTADDPKINQAWQRQRHKIRPKNSPPLSVMGGSLRTTARRGAAASTNYWQWNGTWEDLDSSLTGTIITDVQADYQWRINLREHRLNRNSDATWDAETGSPTYPFYITGDTNGATQDYQDSGSTMNGKPIYQGVTDSSWTVYYDGGSNWIIDKGGTIYYYLSSGDLTYPFTTTSVKGDKGADSISVVEYAPSEAVNGPLASGPFELVLGGTPVAMFSDLDYAPARASGGSLVYPSSGGDNSVAFISPGWQRVNGLNLAVDPAYQSSSSTVGFRLSTLTPITADDVRSWIKIKQDYVVLTITYTHRSVDARGASFFFM